MHLTDQSSILKILGSIFGGNSVLVARLDDRIVGFSTTVIGSPKNILKDPTLPDETGSYLAGVAIHDDFKGRGIYSQMTETSVGSATKDKLPVLFTRTQNPIVEKGLHHTLRKIQGSQDFLSYELERRLITGCYGQTLTKDLPPRVTDEAIQSNYDHMSQEAGDAFVLLFHLLYTNPHRN